MPPNTSYKCSHCGHEFKAADEGEVRCPRCGSLELEENRYLFCTANAEGLTPQDYFDACLSP